MAKKAKKAKPVQSTPSSTDVWMTVFMSIFGVSLFFSGIHSLGMGEQTSASILGIIAALSGGIVIGITIAQLTARRRIK